MRLNDVFGVWIGFPPNNHYYPYAYKRDQLFLSYISNGNKGIQIDPE